MKLIITLTLYCLTLQAESQSYYNQNNEQYIGRSRAVSPDNNGQYVNPYVNNNADSNTISQTYQFGPIAQIEKQKVTEYDSYLQVISKKDNVPDPIPNKNEVIDDGRIYFIEPSVELTPPPYAKNASPDDYSIQWDNNSEKLSTQGSVNKAQQTLTTAAESGTSNDVTIAVSSFGLNLMKAVNQFQTGNVIVSPTSVATLLALLQQGATGETQKQITRSLQLSPSASVSTFSNIVTNMRKRNSRNILSIANNILVADAFNLNNTFKMLAVRNFWSELTPTNFANPMEAIQKTNAWVAAKTNNKITNLLSPGAVSQVTQLVLVNAVYFKGLWDIKFDPALTKPGEFHLGNGAKKTVPFMNVLNNFQVGYDPNNQAVITILPFESHQYSLMLILPRRNDNVANVLSSLTVDLLLYYQRFEENEIKVELPRFTVKTDTDLNPVLKHMGIKNIFGSNSELSGIGLYRTSAPQISDAVHSGFFSVDENGVTAAAATAFTAVALSNDDTSTTFRADRPFVAVLWDNQYSLPLFIAKIEDPS